MNFTPGQKEQFQYIIEKRIATFTAVTKRWLAEINQALDVGNFEPSGLFEARRAFHMVRFNKLALKALKHGDNELENFIKNLNQQIIRHAQWGSRSTDPYSELEVRHSIEAMTTILDTFGLI